MDNFNRVLAFQRWIERVGRDVIVVASLNESTLRDYRIPFSSAGPWREAFNSDVFDNWVNPNVAGNAGRVEAGGPGLNGLSASAAVVIPANSFLVFSQ
jgi:1,4-alpha-glucan branching enzyme